MNKKAIINALLAEAYIVAIVFGMNFTANGAEDNILVPIVMLSLLVLSVAVMGFLFVSKPLRMYIDGAKKEAVNFFLQTVGSFAVITLILFIIWNILAR